MSSRPGRLRSFVLIAPALLALGALHCNATDVVIAEIPQSDGGDEGGPPHHSMPCTTTADCPTSGFCDKHDCEDALGQCHPRPLSCDSNGPAVCGCDGVTYWNDCLRKAGGVPASVMGECENGALCGGPLAEECPGFGASCARLLPGGGPPGPCPPDLPGRCWVLPVRCPPPTGTGFGGGQAWGLCSDPHPLCTDACTAIRTELPFRGLPGPACP